MVIEQKLHDLRSVHKSVVISTKLYFFIALFPLSAFHLKIIHFFLFLFTVNLEGSIACASTMPCVAPTFIIAFENCINPSPSTALNGLTSDTSDATELFNIGSFITFDILVSDLLKYAVTFGDIFVSYLHRFKIRFRFIYFFVYDQDTKSQAKQNI